MADHKPVTLRRFLWLAAVAIALALLIRAYVAEVVYPSSDSMEPTLPRNEFHVVLKFRYLFGAPQRGDIVLLDVAGQGLIKRVIGLPGDRLSIADKKVILNGVELSEPYAVHRDPDTYDSRDRIGEITFPSDFYFVMGDNRDYSKDSRSWGPVRRKQIKGKVLMLY